MADRRVTKTNKATDGDILALCQDSATWSPRSKASAIADIEGKMDRYYVNEAGYQSDVTVVTRDDGTKYLRTVADTGNKNNLDNLPDC